ncbi:MAG: hydrogenase iron-sulfur subunit [Caldiserica bacterium]|jgi:coenzyme F420-reducing hydrogenase delta subunit|nr:hydrogenase iron-sulfur subunit [Caldisericota bacterium]MDH7561793.1 hydrogenase iron-sulfur subunit [Caldisericota bacterium]
MNEFEPKIIAFLCNWCSYAGADLAGVSRFQYPPHVRVIRVPCSGRINPLFILKALYEGADGVLVSGCHPGDCHYQSGNYFARRRLEVFKKLLEFLGINPARLKMAWVSASEGAQFAQLIREFTSEIKEAGRNLEFVRNKEDLVRFLNEYR